MTRHFHFPFVGMALLLATFLMSLSTLTFLSLLTRRARTSSQTYPVHHHHQRRNLATSSFADNFPERNLVLDLMQLSEDIMDDKGNSDDTGSTSSSSTSTTSSTSTSSTSSSSTSTTSSTSTSSTSTISNTNKFEQVFWFEAELSTEVMIVRSRTDRDLPPIVVFRGSEEVDDWKVNTNIVMEKSKFENAPDSVRIHRGFQNALFDQNIVGMVEDKVLELVGESGEVFLTGHSQG